MSRLLGLLAANDGEGCYAVALLEPVVEYPLPEGLPIHILGSPARGGVPMKLAAQVAAFGRLLSLVRRERPRAVVSFMPRSNALNLAGRLCCRRWPRTVVSERVAIRENYRGLTGLLVRQMIQRVYRRADVILAVSEGVADDLRQLGAPADRIVAIPNPVDIQGLQAQADAGRPIPAAEGGSPLLVSVGRLVPQKGYSTLLDALALVRQRQPARLIVFGGGPERSALERRARRLGVSDAVVFAGRHPNPFPTVARADIFVLPSLWEGFPNALLEAMALGRPVIASDCPHGPAELLDRGRFGVLVARGDASALAAALLDLLGDDERRTALGALARRRAGDFDTSTIAARYAEAILGRP